VNLTEFLIRLFVAGFICCVVYPLHEEIQFHVEFLILMTYI